MGDPFSSDDKGSQAVVCYVPYDPASRNIPLGGKIKFTQAVFWISLALVIASLVIGDGVTSFGDNPMLGPSIDDMLRLGGMSQQSVRSGDWWRMFWASFLHAGIIHFLLNMGIWFKLGMLLEPDWGSYRLCTVFILSAFTGNLLSVTLDPINVSIGTSGGIFGLFSANIVYVLEYWETIPDRHIVLIVSVISVIIGIATSFVPFVDVYAHMGGVIGGFLTSGMTMPRCRLFFPATPSATEEETSVFNVMTAEDLQSKEVAAETCPASFYAHHADKSLSTVSSPTPFRPVTSVAQKRLSIVQHEVELAKEQVVPMNRSQCQTSMDEVRIDSIRSPGQPTPDVPSPDGLRLRAYTPQRRFYSSWNVQTGVQLTEPVRAAWWKRQLLKHCSSSNPSHFTWVCDRNAQDRNRTMNLVGATKIVLNPSARCNSLRRTRVIHLTKDYDWTNKWFWAARITMAAMLASMWFVLLYYLYICPECYTAPGQILQMKELKASRQQRLLTPTDKPTFLI